MVKPLKILIVDDTPTNVKQLEVVAVKLGHEAFTAGDGLEGVEKYKEIQPDLVFMDIMMPRMDGIQAVEQIRALPADKWVPIIFFSALDSVHDIVRGLEIGADDYLIKPANLQLMRAKINGFARVLRMQEDIHTSHSELLDWRSESEYQAELGQHVISRLVDERALSDPMLEWFNNPADMFSGDLICSARGPGDVLYVMLADATGHGLAAALTALPLTTVFYGMTAKGFPLRAIAEELNTKLHKLMPADRFVAATLAAIDVRNQTLELWNGGNPTVHYIGGNGEVLHRWASKHPPLGVMPTEFFSGVTETLPVTVAGDLVLCSDGVIEAESAEGKQFSYDGLTQAFATDGKESRFEHLRMALASHLGELKGHDDMSALIVHVPVERRQEARLAEEVTTTVADQNAALVADWKFEVNWGAPELKTVDVVPVVLSMLSHVKALKTHQGALFLILSELFNNALDHGVLGLDSRLKNQPDGFEEYLTQRAARMDALNMAQVAMSFHLHMHDGRPRLNISITDSGPGFDYQKYEARREGNGGAPEAHGRGIALVRGLCEDVIYSGTGNNVLARLAV